MTLPLPRATGSWPSALCTLKISRITCWRAYLPSQNGLPGREGARLRKRIDLQAVREGNLRNAYSIHRCEERRPLASSEQPAAGLTSARRFAHYQRRYAGHASLRCSRHSGICDGLLQPSSFPSSSCPQRRQTRRWQPTSIIIVWLALGS